MRDALDRILEVLARLDRTEVLERLEDGLARDEIHQRLAAAGLESPGHLLDLHSWRNGTRVEPGTSLDDVHFFPGFWFLSLGDALDNHLRFRDDDRWRSDWLPIFANGGGEFYVVVTSADPACVVGFLIDEAEHPVEYESIESMISTLDECYERGVFFVDHRGYLEMRDGEHAEIAMRHNPGVPLWAST